MALIYKIANNINNKGKSIICYDLEGNMIKCYSYIKDAAKELNLNASNIVGVCKGKHKKIGKYKFKYND